MLGCDEIDPPLSTAVVISAIVRISGAAILGLLLSRPPLFFVSPDPQDYFHERTECAVSVRRDQNATGPRKILCGGGAATTWRMFVRSDTLAYIGGSAFAFTCIR
jgi:hypothetical protein